MCAQAPWFRGSVLDKATPAEAQEQETEQFDISRNFDHDHDGLVSIQEIVRPFAEFSKCGARSGFEYYMQERVLLCVERERSDAQILVHFSCWKFDLSN